VFRKGLLIELAKEEIRNKDTIHIEIVIRAWCFKIGKHIPPRFLMKSV